MNTCRIYVSGYNSLGRPEHVLKLLFLHYSFLTIEKKAPREFQILNAWWILQL